MSGLPSVSNGNSGVNTLLNVNPNLNPEVTVAYGLGADVVLPRRTKLSLDLYDDTIHSAFLYSTYAVPLTPTSTIPYSQVSQWLNGPIERNYGLELSLASGNPFGFGFDATATLQRAYYDKLAPSFYALAASTAINGEQISGIPFTQAQAEITYGPAYLTFFTTLRNDIGRLATLNISVAILFNHGTGAPYGFAIYNGGFHRRNSGRTRAAAASLSAAFHNFFRALRHSPFVSRSPRSSPGCKPSSARGGAPCLTGLPKGAVVTSGPNRQRCPRSGRHRRGASRGWNERLGVVSLFGHHHAAPTLAARVADVFGAIAHLPLEVWLTLIPVAGGLAIALVTHRLSVSRDRLALRREDERRRADDERLAQRVRIDLSFRLNRHRDALRNAARGGDVGRLAAELDSLVRRITESDVIDVLGSHYASLMAVLQREEATLARLADSSRGPTLVTERSRAAELAGIEASLEGVTHELGFTASPSSLHG